MNDFGWDLGNLEVYLYRVGYFAFVFSVRVTSLLLMGLMTVSFLEYAALCSGWPFWVTVLEIVVFAGAVHWWSCQVAIGKFREAIALPLAILIFLQQCELKEIWQGGDNLVRVTVEPEDVVWARVIRYGGELCGVAFALFAIPSWVCDEAFSLATISGKVIACAAVFTVVVVVAELALCVLAELLDKYCNFQVEIVVQDEDDESC